MSVVLHAGANFHIPDTDHEPDLSRYTHLLLQNEIPLPSTLAHLRAAGQVRLTTVFNPSPMLSPSELREFPWTDLTWLIVNEGELSSLLEAFGVGLAATKGENTSLRERAEVQLLALHGCSDFAPTVSVICTLGSQGILYFESPSALSGKPTIRHLPAAKLKRPLKDTTGAGDCFAGYFVAGLMRRKEGDGLEWILQTCLTVSSTGDAGCHQSLMNSGMFDVRGE